MHLGNSESIVSVKIKPAMSKIRLLRLTPWKSFAPNQPIRYTFMDERFASMYADVQRMGRIFTSFAVLAIIIACLGLFALAAFMAEQRSKEIGIRKVLGATIGNITTLLSFDFIKLVFIAIVIASPIAWWAMTKWLQDFNIPHQHKLVDVCPCRCRIHSNSSCNGKLSKHQSRVDEPGKKFESGIKGGIK
jgi:putative ABC transport system permease protein